MDLHVMLHPDPTATPTLHSSAPVAALLYAGPEETRQFVGAVTLTADVAQALADRVNGVGLDDDARIDALHGPGAAAALNQAIADGSVFGEQPETTAASPVVCYLDVDGDPWVRQGKLWRSGDSAQTFDTPEDLAHAFGPLTPLVRQ